MTVYLNGTGITFNDGSSISTAGSSGGLTYYSGYFRDRQGLLWQFGNSQGVGSYGQPSVIYFPTTFPNACWAVFGTNNWDANGITIAVYSWNNSYFYINRTYYACWFAVGY